MKRNLSRRILNGRIEYGDLNTLKRLVRLAEGEELSEKEMKKLEKSFDISILKNPQNYLNDLEGRMHNEIHKKHSLFETFSILYTIKILGGDVLIYERARGENKANIRFACIQIKKNFDDEEVFYGIRAFSK